MLPIKNTEDLLRQGDKKVRETLLAIANKALDNLNSERLVKSLVRLEGDTLHVGDLSWDLTRYNRIFVFGAGKACNHMARAIDTILGPRITKGIVIVKQLEDDDTPKYLELALGGHPYPNESGWRATLRILGIVETLRPDDLVICLISGGSSALMNFPATGISVEEESLLTEQLLTAGAKILEINAVRRHISAVNGGRLAQKISARGAELISLVLSDRVGDDAIGTPRVPVLYLGTQIGVDLSTFADAWTIMERYGLLDKAPVSIVEHLRRGPSLEETPKVILPGVNTFVIQGLEDACQAALEAAAEENIPGVVLTSYFEGESSQAGMILGSIAREVRCNARPVSAPCILIAVGETTVKLDGPAGGRGGPSQELALAFANQVDGLDGIGIAAIETEGTDGTTDLAGALADGTTAARAREAGIDIHKVLRVHDAYAAVTTLGEGLFTGNTGTNLCDLNIVYIR